MKPRACLFIRNCANGNNSNLALRHIYGRLDLYVTPVVPARHLWIADHPNLAVLIRRQDLAAVADLAKTVERPRFVSIVRPLGVSTQTQILNAFCLRFRITGEGVVNAGLRRLDH